MLISQPDVREMPHNSINARKASAAVAAALFVLGKIIKSPSKNAIIVSARAVVAAPINDAPPAALTNLQR